MNTRLMAVVTPADDIGLARSVFRERLVHIAVQPALSRLRRGHHGVRARLRVPRRVAVGRAVATERHAAGLTCPQVHPGVTGFYAFFAEVFVRLFDLNGLEMVAAFYR